MNDKGVMTRLVIVELRFLKMSLHTFLDVHKLFIQHSLEWMALILGSYSEEMV